MRTAEHDLVFGMAGSGGDGVVSAGETLLGALSLEGYHAIMTKSFGSQIRGGEASCRVRVSTRRIFNPGGALDVAVALNWEDFAKFGAELPLAAGTILIHEEKSGAPPPTLGDLPSTIVPVPITDSTKSTAGTDKAKMSFVLGLLSGWFGIPAVPLARNLKKKFASKGEEVLAANQRALDGGIEYARAHPLPLPRTLAAAAAGRGSKLLCDGNDMCAAGALFSGVEFFGGYPITPSTEVMQTLSRELWKHGGVVLQAEDEIAGVGSAVGASFAGRKSMTATSGPGMSLKTEVLGLASIAELPLVVLDVQRGGPSTGIPTKPEQSDLFQAAFSAHGDVLRPVLAPTTVADTFRITVEAFNIAEHYQTPVVLLSDQEIAQRKETVDPIDTERLVVVDRRRPQGAELEPYARFRATESGISPISAPGLRGGAYQGAGIEHNEKGEPTASGAMHARMNAKRFRKLEPLEARHDLFEVLGRAEAPLALLSWGSSAGVAREAFELATQRGLDVKLLVPYLVYPVARGIYREFFASVRAGLVLELSHQGQLYRILRMYVDVPRGVQSFARSGAHPFQPAEVLARLVEIARAEELDMQAGERSAGTATAPVLKDYNSGLKPIWCPGCGDYGVLQGIYRALTSIGRPPHEIAFISGIGCSSRIPGYTTAYGFNSVHGRALPIAQGVKLANPDLLVLVAGGDGDGFSIGGGHVAHAVRRNIDITYIVMDNQVYGLTKGQLSPTSPRGLKTITSPFGSLEQPINPLLYLLAYGAGFVAQSTPADMPGMTALIEEAIRYPGFSFLNIQSPCVTFGEENQQMRAHKSSMKSLASLGHDPSDMAAALRLAHAYGTELHTGVFYRNPSPPPTYEELVRVRQAALSKDALPRSRVLESYLQK